MEKEYEMTIGLKVVCKPIEFSSPVVGTIKCIYNNTIAIDIVKVQTIDKYVAIDKNYVAIARFKDVISF